jgi:hypothetical protein
MPAAIRRSRAGFRGRCGESRPDRDGSHGSIVIHVVRAHQLIVERLDTAVMRVGGGGRSFASPHVSGGHGG